MARYIGPIQKKLRSLGLDRFGAYNERKKVSTTFSRKRVSEYGLQLIEKQKAKFLYGVLERQFSNYYKKASKISGSTGENLIVLLEKRLDNVLYRAGLFSTRKQSRQAVNHGHFLVNDKIVNIPSYQLRAGDVIKVRDKSKKVPIFQDSIRRVDGDNPMPWLSLDKAKLTGTFVEAPNREDVAEPINEQLVVELYSK